MHTTKGLRTAGLTALAHIRRHPGVNTAELDRACRTARGGHAWMYRTVDRLIKRGLVRTGPARSGRGGGLYATSDA